MVLSLRAALISGCCHDDLLVSPLWRKGRGKGWLSVPVVSYQETLVLFCHCCKGKEPRPEMLLSKGIQIGSKKKNQAPFQVAVSRQAGTRDQETVRTTLASHVLPHFKGAGLI